jgi:hypothetical protein
VCRVATAGGALACIGGGAIAARCRATVGPEGTEISAACSPGAASPVVGSEVRLPVGGGTAGGVAGDNGVVVLEVWMRHWKRRQWKGRVAQ